MTADDQSYVRDGVGESSANIILRKYYMQHINRWSTSQEKKSHRSSHNTVQYVAE